MRLDLGDLHALDVGTVPKGFHEFVRKPEDQHVANRTLPKVMVDTEHLRFVESAEYDFVKGAGRFEVVAERLLDHDACASGTTGVFKVLDDWPEQYWWNRQIVCRMLSFTEFFAERIERGAVPVVARDVFQQSAQFVKRGRIKPAVLLHTVFSAGTQLVEAPSRFRHTDHRNVQMAAPDHRLQRRKDLLVRKIAGCTEENQSVRMHFAHSSILMRPSRGVHQTRIASPRGACPDSRRHRAR